MTAVNIPLHLYLANLVGDVNELIITTDNAKLPCPNHPYYRSGHNNNNNSSSSSSSTQVFGASFASLNNSDASISSSSTCGSASRWDSACRSSPCPAGKERLPKKPLRRRDSPPTSPTTERRLRRLAHEMSESEGDVLKASAKDFPAMVPIRLSAAAQDFIRKPVRRNSLTRTTNSGDQLRNDDGVSLKKKSAKPMLGNPTGPPRNVSDILGEAIRELGFADDDMDSKDDGNSSSAAMAAAAMLCANAPEFEKVSC